MSLITKPSEIIPVMLTAGATKILTAIIAAITLPFIIRNLGIEQFGSWSFVLVIIGLAELISNPGISTYAQRHIALERDSSSDFLKSAITLRLILSLVACFGLVIFAVYFEENVYIRNLLLTYGILQLILNAFSSAYVLVSNEKFYSSASVALISQAIYAGGVFIFVRNPEDIYILATFVFISSLVNTIFSWVRISTIKFEFGLLFSRELFEIILKNSTRYGLASLMSQMYTRAGHITVRYFLGDQALGIYSAVTRFSEVCFMPVMIGYGVMMPRISLFSGDKNKAKDLISKGFLSGLMIAMPLFIGGLILADELAIIAFGDKFEDSRILFTIVSLYFISNMCSTFFSGTILYSLGRHNRYLYSTMIGGIVGLVFYPILTVYFGIYGAVFNYSLIQFFVAISAFFFAIDYVDDLRKNSFVLNTVIQIFIYSLVMAGSIIALHSLGINLWILIPLGIFIYSALMLLFSSKKLKIIFSW